MTGRNSLSVKVLNIKYNEQNIVIKTQVKKKIVFLLISHLNIVKRKLYLFKQVI